MRGYGETNEAKPLKLQGKCCFWGFLSHTNKLKQVLVEQPLQEQKLLEQQQQQSKTTTR